MTKSLFDDKGIESLVIDIDGNKGKIIRGKIIVQIKPGSLWKVFDPIKEALKEKGYISFSPYRLSKGKYELLFYKKEE